MAANPNTNPPERSSNAFARERDARICWLLERHPVTAAMLVEIQLFTDRKRAIKRLNRLCERRQLKLAGTVSLKDGRPEHVYCRSRWAAKGDTLLHEVLVSRVCFKIHATEVRRGPDQVDSFLRPDAELRISGQRYLLEVDCGTMSYQQVVSERFTKYGSCQDIVLWVCSTEARAEGLRTQAQVLSGVALFTTLPLALANPHAPIWRDYAGETAALPRG